ncbi:hypothetical protein F5B19DRAFT_487964 [Rostrohypoxylon terebratum]|nr:hypothetical protein F5B19DRAFT_487964 [Rostrohypoxylon terebratum]
MDRMDLMNLIRPMKKRSKSRKSRGRHRGTRLDQLDGNYRWGIYRLAREEPEQSWLHDEYMAWLDERQNPLSHKIWFGRYWKGKPLEHSYKTPGSWKFMINNSSWGPELKGIERRYKAWLAKHPNVAPARPSFQRLLSVQKPLVPSPPVPSPPDSSTSPIIQSPVRARRPRARYVIQNPVGKRLGPEDDGVATDNDEDYTTDDGFVVRDDEEDEWEEAAAIGLPVGWNPYLDDDDNNYMYDEEPDKEASTLQDEDEDDDEYKDGDEEPGEEKRDRRVKTPPIRDVDSDSSTSLPSIGEIVRRSASKKTPVSTRSKQRFQPYPNTTPTKSRTTHQRYIVGSDDDDDEDDDDMPTFTPSMSTGRIKKTVGFGQPQGTPSRPPKNGKSTIIVLSSDSEMDENSPTSRKNRSHRSLVQTAAPIDSDDEPLVPKLLRERLAEASAKKRRR